MSAYVPLSSAHPKKPLVWSDWLSQMQHRVTTLEQLREWIDVTDDEARAIEASEGKYRWSITPYYASLMDRVDANCPVRLQAVPSLGEFTPFANASVDPVGDTVYRKTNRVIHKYPDRVIMLVTDLCPVYCRHCTRKYHTTDLSGTYFGEGEAASWEPDFDYIERTPAIRDVLLTGGDPLTLSNERLDTILGRLRQIRHVEIVRIGSRYPVLLPQRITPEFCDMLEQHHPVWFNTHFNHPKEITPESAAAADRLLRHGIPVGNQTVLLKGINDNLETMRRLMTELVRIRVRPYYLYHCDNVTGVSHFVTDLEVGRSIMRGLIGHVTGFAVPQYVLTTPLGKIALAEEQIHNGDQGLWVHNYKGETMPVSDFMTPTERDAEQ